MKFRRRVLFNVAAACTLASLCTPASGAATITFLGSDTTTGAGWRSTSVAKNPVFDPGGDDAYGNDGYFLVANGSSDGPAAITSSLPQFISTGQVRGAVPNYSANSYVSYDDPTLGIGPAVADQQGGIFYFTNTDFNDPKYGMMGFTLASDAHFVVTILLSQGRPSGTGGSSALAVQQVTDFWDVGILASADVTNEQMPVFASQADYLFFEIDGRAGDNFQIAMNGAQNSGFAGIAFESVPEPSVSIVAGLGLLGLLRRRR